MKFKEFVSNVNAMLKNRPETGEFDVFCSKDDEGNGFNEIEFTPSVGKMDDGYWYSDDEEYHDKPNAVCVN